MRGHTTGKQVHGIRVMDPGMAIHCFLEALHDLIIYKRVTSLQKSFKTSNDSPFVLVPFGTTQVMISHQNNQLLTPQNL